MPLKLLTTYRYRLLLQHTYRHNHMLQVRNVANNENKLVGCSDLTNMRNIGILAHIDAGKTSTTECMLFHAGVVKKIGRIDDGDTRMDFMKQERERGITINAANIAFNWLNRTVNLIDTPGHVDFNFEVERCLHVLDSAVLVLDGTEGVQPQTISINKQMTEWTLPRLIYTNKMDRKNADFDRSIKALRKELEVNPVVYTRPVYINGMFRGVVDLISMIVRIHTKNNIQCFPVNGENGGFNEQLIEMGVNRENLEIIIHSRTKLIEELVSFDENLLEEYFEGKTPSPENLKRLLRSCCVNQQVSPVLCGSAVTNIGIDLLLNAIVEYLPSPLDRIESHFPVNFHHDANSPLIAYAFKVIQDRNRGSLVYLRVYSGVLKSHSHIYRLGDRGSEKINRLLLSQAGDLKEIRAVGPGNIGVAVGLKETQTGDVITSDETILTEITKQIETANDCVTKRTASPSQTWLTNLIKLNVPDAVFYCTLYVDSKEEERELVKALNQLTTEDPSLRYKIDPNNEDLVVSGMGDLHLQILIDRLKHEYRIIVKLGKLSIAYQEVPTIVSKEVYETTSTMSGREQHVEIGLRVIPGGQNIKVVNRLGNEVVISRDQLKAIQNAVRAVCVGGGPLIHGPVTELSVELTDFTCEEVTSLNIVSYATRECLTKALRNSELRLSEPVMKVEIKLSEEYVEAVLADLANNRRGIVKRVLTDARASCLEAEVPLEHLLQYSNVVRGLTSGYGEYSSRFLTYRQVANEHQKTIIDRYKGY
ncbi:hypothetical protein LOD99_9713 [Oopsacas minuta]|uniref:Tr-type G domain-containing protein n=1 Tax=Oopsacas minuta TaxID=111878 RepID=A0AAV7KN47_9METZ|nr:hypothetical protein LOD99_9713 [Oopsacas minuta]